MGIEAVNTIPLPHHGPENPLASDTDSEVPQAPAKPVERVKEEKPPPDAVPIKSKTPKKTPAEVASEKNKLPASSRTGSVSGVQQIGAGGVEPGFFGGRRRAA